MKLYIVFISVLLTISSCSTNPNNYPNIKTEQVFSQLKWGLHYSSVHKILTEEYKLEYSTEYPNESVKGFKYTGGKYNDMNTKTWIATFVNDSLFMVQIVVYSDQVNEKELFYKKICEQNDKEFTKDSTSEEHQNRWYLEKDGKRVTNILVSNWSTQKEFPILYSRGY